MKVKGRNLLELHVTQEINTPESVLFILDFSRRLGRIGAAFGTLGNRKGRYI